MGDIGSLAQISPISSLTTALGSTQGDLAVSLDGGNTPPEPAFQPAPPTDNRYSPPPSLPSSLLSLPIKQIAFVQAITDRDNPVTFGNQTRSAMAAGYTTDVGVAGDVGHDLAKKPGIRNAINDILAARGLGGSDRAGIISELAHQRYAEIRHYDADGNLTQRQVVDNGKVRLAAVREAGKLAGDYARADNVARAQRDAIKPLVAHYAKMLKDSLRDGTAGGTVVDPEGAGSTAGGAIVDPDGPGSSGGSAPSPDMPLDATGEATVNATPVSVDKDVVGKQDAVEGQTGD